MTPEGGVRTPTVGRRGFGRFAALGALVLAAIAVAWILLGGGDGNRYRLLFETGGQLVPDNEVLIGGQPVGSVESVELTDNGEAEVEISIDRVLHEGTSAVIRSTSLSGIANRYVSITPGPNSSPELAGGSVITQVDTTTSVDLDQLFNALKEPERKGLQDIIQGSATAYAGRAADANEAYRYLSPALSATDQLIQQLLRDERVFTDFLVSGGRVVTAVAERRDDLSGLVSNSNEALGAIASQNRNFDRALRALPPALRQANTTFFNLRLTLDDLDPFVETAKATTKNLAPFLADLKPVVKRSVPVFHDLRLSVNRKGKNNDLADAFAKLPSVDSAAQRAVPAAVQAMNDSLPQLSFLRAYSPDLVGAVAGLNQASAYYDDAGHYTRVEPAGLNVFDYNGATNDLLPVINAGQQYDGYNPPIGSVVPNTAPSLSFFRRCPGGATQVSTDASNPFVGPVGGLWAGSGLTSPAPPGDCNFTDRPPGP